MLARLCCVGMCADMCLYVCNGLWSCLVLSCLRVVLACVGAVVCVCGGGGAGGGGFDQVAADLLAIASLQRLYEPEVRAELQGVHIDIIDS
jgi:hypothetical protein